MKASLRVLKTDLGRDDNRPHTELHTTKDIRGHIDFRQNK